MQTIVTKYHPATTYTGARMSATNTAGKRVTLRPSGEIVGDEEDHARVARKLAQEIGGQWPSSPMIGGTLNVRGDMVWVFEEPQSPRTLPPKLPEPPALIDALIVILAALESAEPYELRTASLRLKDLATDLRYKASERRTAAALRAAVLEVIK
jgi:hypothetical protein